MFKTFVLLSLLHFTDGSQIYELKCWIRTNQHKAQGMRKAANIIDVVDCTKKCREKNFCHAVDMVSNTSNPQCWLQSENTNAPNAHSLIRSDYVTNYLHDPICGEITDGVDLNCWTVTPGYRMLEMQKVNAYTLPECFEECIRMNECRSVDWDIGTSPKCWLQNHSPNVSSPKLKSPSATNFVLNRNCLQLIAGLDMKFWIVSDRMEYPVLSPVDRLDIRSCVEYCRLNELCNIFDYDPLATPPCWAKTKAHEVQRGSLFESESSYNFFFKQKKYEANLKTAASFEEMSSCWLHKNNTSYSGTSKTSIPSVKSLKECLNKCFLNSSCGAVVFTPFVDEPCRNIQEPIDMVDFTETRRVYSYIPHRKCNLLK